MIEDKIYVRFIDKNLQLKVIEESVTGLDYVEQLVHRVLDNEGVGPVYRCLFALRPLNETIWFAPNADLKIIHAWSHETSKGVQEPRLELRMRFQPASYERLAYVDKIALDIIFAQIRADFLRTRFNDEKRAFVLLDETVLGMIVLDLIRHSIERDIDIEQILDKVNPRDFLPKRAAAWQRAIMFHIDKQINLRKAVRLGYEKCDKDTRTLKRKYIELFLTSVADKYGAETYIVHQLLPSIAADGAAAPEPAPTPPLPSRSAKLVLRVQFVVTRDETRCIVETAQYRDSGDEFERFLRSKKSVPSENWSQICDIETINHATLRHNIAQLTRDNGHPLRFQFQSRWHAESFLSNLDGYYRLMRKWNLNIFRDIRSPSLMRLRQLESHGPIGFESARRKLVEFERPGDFIVRQCMKVNDRYLIDTTLFSSKVILTIHVDWCVSDRKFRLSGHSMNRDGLEVTIETAHTDYSKLAHMIRDIEIRVFYKSQSPLTKQLKHWIHPQDDDHYPALMLSMSEKRLEELESSHNFNLNGSMGQLPNVIPVQFIKAVSKRFDNLSNGLIVDLATTVNGKNVIVKDFSAKQAEERDETTGASSRSQRSERYTFHVCQENPSNDCIGAARYSCQLRVADWAFVKSHLFAETIGYVMSGALVQEYFPLGPLDQFLKTNEHLDRLVKLSVSFQLIQTLLYLNQRKIIHGKFRCHNVMIKQLHPMQIKLTDPLGSLNVEQDQAFIPPEYFNSVIGTCVKRFCSGIDVWAFGTTMWQIFNDGSRPPCGRYANTLTHPRSCPDDVWRLIEACWVVEPTSRATPQALFRDLCDLLAWEKGAHDYFYISPEDSIASNPDQPLASPLSSNPDSNNHLVQLNQSPISSNGRAGSQTNLIPLTRADQSVSNGHDVISTSSSGSGTTTTSRSDARMISNNQTSIRKATWRRFISIGKNQRPYTSSLPSHNSFADIFGSSSSLNSCTTPSGSEITRLTILDLENISDAFDRCVWHIDSNRLKLGREIGRGSSGVVMMGTMSQADGDGSCDKVVAVKCIPKDSSNHGVVNQIEDLRREFDILKNLDHENIVKALGYVEESQLMLIFEFMPLGSLLSWVKKMDNPDDLHKLPLQKYALDIAKGMEYLESKKIVHRDLALRNILLSGRNEVKICDFGLAKSLGSEDFYKLETERALPLKWYAPETISTQVFTHKSDVWSYGVLLWEIYTGGDNPHYSGTYANLSETLKHERLRMPMKCPKHMYDLMLNCWAYKAEDRMTFAQTRVFIENLTKSLK